MKEYITEEEKKAAIEAPDEIKVNGLVLQKRLLADDGFLYAADEEEFEDLSEQTRVVYVLDKFIPKAD